MITAARCASATTSTLEKELVMTHSIRSSPRWMSISRLGIKDQQIRISGQREDVLAMWEVYDFT